MYTTGTNGRDVSIFMKLCYEFWAYCVNGTSQMLTITAASNANPITITTSAPHGLVSNQLVGIYGVNGNTAANGGWNISVVNTTQFTLNGAVGNGAYTNGGVVCIPTGVPISPTSSPQGFFEGSSVLAIGNDGVTSAIGNTLTAAASQPFTPSMLNKHVVVWLAGANTGVSNASAGQSLPQTTINVQSTTGFDTTGTIFVVTSDGVQQVTYTGLTATSFTSCSGGTGVMAQNASVSVNEESTDDSIYRIVAVPSNTQVVLAPFSGGTTDISTLKNNLTSRAALSYRVIDVIAASQLSIASGNYFIGTLRGSPNINTGQATSQFQFLLRGSASTFGQMGMVGSPNGSWNGSAFSGTGSNATMTERTTGTSITTGSSAINGFVTIIADTDYMFAHVRSGNGSNGIYFMVTTPQRIYTQAQDPNLLAILVGGNFLNNTNGTDSFCTSFGMVGFDGVTRSHTLLTRNLLGDTGNANVGLNYTVGASLDRLLGYGKLTGRILTTEPLMSVSSTVGQFSFARAKIRPFVFTFGAVPAYYLLGDSGEFIHLVNGICMPWDGSILPYPLLAGGT
jgi:hypothetical protein